MLIEALVLTWKQHNFSLVPGFARAVIPLILEKLSQNKKLVEEDIAISKEFYNGRIH